MVYMGIVSKALQMMFLITKQNQQCNKQAVNLITSGLKFMGMHVTKQSHAGHLWLKNEKAHRNVGLNCLCDLSWNLRGCVS